jgi:phage pi2 protein 07
MDSVEISAIFENPNEASALDGSNQDLWDKEYPLEESLVSTVMELVVKYLGGAIYQPEDPTNNADDDLSDIQSFIRQNMKDKYLKDTSSE